MPCVNTETSSGDLSGNTEVTRSARVDFALVSGSMVLKRRCGSIWEVGRWRKEWIN